MKLHPSIRRVAAIAALLAAGSASAHLITFQVGAGNQFIAGGPVPLLGMTSAPFNNLAGQLFVVTFSAECAVNAPDHVTTTDVDLVVLDMFGAVVQTIAPTTGNGDAFCTANGTGGFDGWSRNSITAVGGRGLPAAMYRVQARGRVGGGFQASYGERALVISR